MGNPEMPEIDPRLAKFKAKREREHTISDERKAKVVSQLKQVVQDLDDSGVETWALRGVCFDTKHQQIVKVKGSDAALMISRDQESVAIQAIERLENFKVYTAPFPPCKKYAVGQDGTVFELIIFDQQPSGVYLETGKGGSVNKVKISSAFSSEKTQFGDMEVNVISGEGIVNAYKEAYLEALKLGDICALRAIRDLLPENEIQSIEAQANITLDEILEEKIKSHQAGTTAVNEKANEIGQWEDREVAFSWDELNHAIVRAQATLVNEVGLPEDEEISGAQAFQALQAIPEIQKFMAQKDHLVGSILASLPRVQRVENLGELMVAMEKMVLDSVSVQNIKERGGKRYAKFMVCEVEKEPTKDTQSG